MEMLTPNAIGVSEAEAAVGEAEPVDANAAIAQTITTAKPKDDRRSEGLVTQLVVDQERTRPDPRFGLQSSTLCVGWR